MKPIEPPAHFVHFFALDPGALMQPWLKHLYDTVSYRPQCRADAHEAFERKICMCPEEMWNLSEFLIAQGMYASAIPLLQKAVDDGWQQLEARGVPRDAQGLYHHVRTRVQMTRVLLEIICVL